MLLTIFCVLLNRGPQGPWVLGKRLPKSHVSGIHLMQGLGLFLNIFFLELTILKGL